MAQDFTIGILSGSTAGTLTGKDYTTDIATINTSIGDLETQLETQLSDIKDSIDSLTTQMAAIESTLNSISSDISSFVTRAANEEQGNYVNSINEGNLTDAQQRALQIVAIRESGLLDAIRSEITNPTTLPGD